MRNAFRMTIGACTLTALGLLLDACADPTAEPEQEPASEPAPATSAPVATALNPSEAEVKEALALAKRVFEAADPKAAYSALGEADRLKVDGVTLPHTLEIHDSEPEPSDVQNPGPYAPGSSAYTGCRSIHATGSKKALFGNTLYTFWQDTHICAKNNSVNKVWVSGANGETSTPGWRIAHAPTTTALNVRWEGRGVARYYFVFGAGGWDIQHPTDCLQGLVNANGRDSRVTRSCDLQRP
jgi:hypothetical protein